MNAGPQQEQLDTRAIEIASETSGVLRTHLAHHDHMEAEAAVDRRELRQSVSKVHTRIDEIAKEQQKATNRVLISLIGIFLAIIGWMLVNPLPWVDMKLNIGP